MKAYADQFTGNIADEVLKINQLTNSGESTGSVINVRNINRQLIYLKSQIDGSVTEKMRTQVSMTNPNYKSIISSAYYQNIEDPMRDFLNVSMYDTLHNLIDKKLRLYIDDLVDEVDSSLTSHLTKNKNTLDKQSTLYRKLINSSTSIYRNIICTNVNSYNLVVSLMSEIPTNEHVLLEFVSSSSVLCIKLESLSCYYIILPLKRKSSSVFLSLHLSIYQNNDIHDTQSVCHQLFHPKTRCSYQDRCVWFSSIVLHHKSFLLL